MKTSKYANEFISLSSSSLFIETEVFPNFKEVTESFGAYHAVRRYLWRKGFGPKNRNVELYVVGDGSTPRTAMTFALRSAWNCFSIDPNLRLKKRYDKIKRLTLLPIDVKTLKVSSAHGNILVVAVHSHANLLHAIGSFRTGGKLAVVAMPCCVPQEINGTTPDITYRDADVWSPENLVKIWENLNER